MKAFSILAALPLLALAQQPSHDYPIRPVPFTSVKVHDRFWAPRIEINRAATIPFAFKMEEETGRVDNFVRAATALRGEPLANRTAPGYPFDDSDVYKVIEGASFALSVKPDPALDAYLDKLIATIAAAQEKDGYLYTTRAIDPAHPHPWAGPRRWMLEGVDSHELYNLGHLYEAAAAHYQATGKRNLLDVALRTANLLTDTFGPGKQSIWPGHQITEMGLARLYRATGEQRYLDLAKFLLDTRGPGPQQGGGRQYNQSHAKVTEQSEAVGHAVRATYMYSGMADVAALTGDRSYTEAINRIWQDVATKKLYITGGIGARSSGEAFGAPYELPNMSAYNETCAAIGNDYWNHRLFLLAGDSKYIDVFERTLYNGLVSGVSLDGKTFFYPNPLESNGQHARSPWFGCACCPGNITRFIASVPGYVYAQRASELWANLYMASTATVKLDDGLEIKLTQATDYPWDGNVKFVVEPKREANFTFHLRIPGWARNQPVPSDLYRYIDSPSTAFAVLVNGKQAPATPIKGYVSLNRSWRPGDIVELRLPMPVRRVAANPQVAADRGRIALERGPVVYTLEWPDNPGAKVRHLMLEDSAPLKAEFRPALLGSVAVITGQAVALAQNAQGATTRRPYHFTAIPYATWANRGRGQMTVWIPNAESAARPEPFPTAATTAKLTTSGKKNPAMINDGEQPANSADHASYFDWWPTKGATEWVEMALAKPTRVSQAEIYWFDDTGRGEVRVPASWRLLYKDGDTWKPVTPKSPYSTTKDAFNKLEFEPVTTTAMRLEVTMQPNFSAGLHEWKLN